MDPYTAFSGYLTVCLSLEATMLACSEFVTVVKKKSMLSLIFCHFLTNKIKVLYTFSCLNSYDLLSRNTNPNNTISEQS